MKMPWDEKVTILSINPDAASRDDIARLASDVVHLRDLADRWKRFRSAPGTSLLTLALLFLSTEQMQELTRALADRCGYKVKKVKP